MCDPARRLDVRAFPTFARMIATQVGEGWQDTAGEAIEAAVDADLAFERLTEVLEKEILTEGG